MPRPITSETFNANGDLYCTTCKEHKPVAQFSKGGPVHRDHRSYRCKSCRSAYYKANKEQTRTQVRNWIANNRERYNEVQRARQDSRYHRRYRGVVDGVKYDWVVYKLVFKTGHYYFGSTCQLRTRLSVHKSKLKHGNHCAALNKMQGVPYKVEVLFESADQDVTRQEESRLFGHAMATDPNKCLNTYNYARVFHDVLDPTLDLTA